MKFEDIVDYDNADHIRIFKFLEGFPMDDLDGFIEEDVEYFENRRRMDEKHVAEQEFLKETEELEQHPFVIFARNKFSFRGMTRDQVSELRAFAREMEFEATKRLDGLLVQNFGLNLENTEPEPGLLHHR